MTRFLSSFVTLFGIAILAVIAWFALQAMMEPKADKAARIQSRRSDVPKCDLPPLDLGPSDRFVQQMGTLYQDSGINAVRDYLEKEFVPGRVIEVGSTSHEEPPTSYVLLDREMRRCDAEGAVLLTQAPVVARAVANLRLGDDSMLRTWSRTDVQQPFAITAWWIRKRQ